MCFFSARKKACARVPVTRERDESGAYYAMLDLFRVLSVAAVESPYVERYNTVQHSSTLHYTTKRAQQSGISVR